VDNVNFIRSQVVQAPQDEFLTLDEVKAHLRVDSDYEDVYITSLIGVAIDEAQSITNRRFGDQIIEAYYEHWQPVTLYTCGVVQSVELYMRGKDGDWTLIDADKYELVKAVPAFIHYRNDFSEPVHNDYYEMVKVSVSCGEPVPPSVKQWMLLRIGTLYDNRQADTERPAKPQDFAVELLNAHKIIEFA
jgi:uncharacterized phiE125 gp8 family phage protein